MRLDRLFPKNGSVNEDPFYLPYCCPESNSGNNPFKFDALLNASPQARIHPKTALRSTYG